MMKWILVSVFEREIQARGFETHEEARREMLCQLREEYLQSVEGYDMQDRLDYEKMWDSIAENAEYNDGDIGFDGFSAYSNLDSSRNCDWKIFSTGEIWW